MAITILAGGTGMSSNICSPVQAKDSPGEIVLKDSRKIRLASAEQKADANRVFDGLARDYLEQFFKDKPVDATYFGIHEQDSNLPPVTPDSVKEELERLKAYSKRFQNVDFKSLSRDNKIDWNLIVSNIEARILDLDEVEEWRRNPDYYSTQANLSVFTLIQREFAPKEERLKSVIARQKQIPLYLENARSNLDMNLVPPVFVDIALESLPGIISFFKKDLPAYFKDVKDLKDPEDQSLYGALYESFEKENEACLAALTSYRDFLEKEGRAQAKGDFAIGEKRYLNKLYAEELVKDSVDNLIARGEAELARLQRQFKEAARAIEPDRTGDKIDERKVYEKVAAKHPAPDKLIKAVSDVLEEIREFCIKKPVVTIPGDDRATVDEMPPHMRALAFAAMDTPGPFEKKAKEAYYFVTLPEKSWDEKKVEEHMRSFSDQDLLNTSIHEAYPGHYVQFLWVNRAPSSIRKVFGCNSNAEGWAHYCEQMMLEEGFKGASPELRITQIHDALLRVCRYIAGLKMHTRGMSLEQAIELFEKEGFIEHANAEREARRGTMEPTYLVYTLGKLEILSMRDEYRKKVGDGFSLRDFHDLFLKQGYPPLALVRAQMLQEEVEKYF